MREENLTKCFEIFRGEISKRMASYIDAPAEVRGQDDAAKAQWFPLSELPTLAFDHTDIMEDAIALLPQVGIT